MLEYLSGKLTALVASVVPVAPTIDILGSSNKITIDLEFTVCVILFNAFVLAPYLMGSQYTAIMGDVVRNIWPVALAAIAPVVTKPGSKLLDFWVATKMKDTPVNVL